MKKYLLLALFICGCVPSHDRERAHKSVEIYIQQIYNDPRLEPVAFTELVKKRYSTQLDSSLNYAHIDPENHKKVKKYVDSESAQRPDLTDKNTKDLDDMEHGRLIYYSMIYSFRVDSSGHKKLMRYHFELDTAFRVLKATDITYYRGKDQE